MKKLLLLVSFVLMFTMVFAGCKSGESGDNGDSAGTSEGTFEHNHSDLVVCVGPDTESLDPGVNASTDGCLIIQHAYEGLYRLDSNGFPEPAQATHYDLSDDLTVYTFYLRDGLKWTDGQPVTAQQFEQAWKRNVDPATGGHYDYMLDIMKGYDAVVETGDLDALCVKALDEKTLQVELNAPCAYFLELLAFPTYMPLRMDLIDQLGDAWAVKPETYVSNGAFKMTDWVPGSHITFVRNENYWDIASIGPNSIKFRLIEDDNAALAAFEAGELVYVDSKIPVNEIPRLKQGTEFGVGKQLGTYYVDFNNSIEKFAKATDAVKKALSDVRVRQALSLAIDRQFIVEQIAQGGQIPASRFVGPGFNDALPGKSFSEIGGDPFDPFDHAGNVKRAKELLAEAGYPNGEGFPTIEYMYNTNTNHQAIGERIQHDWAQIGVNCTLSSQEWSVFLATRPQGDFEVARDGWIADYNDPMTMLDMFMIGGGNNNCQYNNPEYDRLIKAAKVEGDPVKRFELMHQADDMLMADWAIAPVYHYTKLYMEKGNLKGVNRLDIGYTQFHYAWLE